MRIRHTVAMATLVGLLATPAVGQQLATVDDTERLREVVAAQQQELAAQRRMLEQLQELVLRQGRALQALTATMPQSQSSASIAESASPVPQAPPLMAEPEQQKVNPTQEVAREVPQGPALEVGPARLRVGGYLGLTGIYRSTNAGGSVSTPFGSIPFEDSVQGSVSEARLSAQATRLSIRVDAPFADTAARFSKLAGYFEMDFAGDVPDTVAVSSSSVGLRLRQGFGEIVFRQKAFLAVGQAFSLMTPPKGQLSIWPSDFDLSQAVDTGYLVGLIWTRSPQVRFTWRPSTRFNWAVSAENPEQQVGKEQVSFPVCCAEDLGAQYNTGTNGLEVPNLMPDLATRVAFNPTETVHMDVGGVFRSFRHTLQAYRRDFSQAGGGVSANLGLKPSPTARLILQAAYGAGLGRYVGGLVPDLIVGSDGSIKPVTTFSWVGGLELASSTSTSLAGYYSGVRAGDEVAVDADGTLIGYGYDGSPDSHNRLIQEATGVLTHRLVTSDRGSVQWALQVSWLQRAPWSARPGLASADAFLFFTQIRYNLP